MHAIRGAITALVTPFTEDASAVDLDRLARNLEFQHLAGVRGVVPCGTTGEAPVLSEGEHRRVVERCIEVAAPLGLAVIAGSGSNDTRHAVDQHRFAASAGADASLHVTPYYNRPSQEGIYRHYAAIADSCDLPTVLYHVPARTSVTMTLPTIVRLSEHPNIVAIKEASGSMDLASGIRGETDLVLLSGDDTLTLPLGALGAEGVISVIANLVPHLVAALCAALARGDLAEARALHDETFPLARGLLTLEPNPVPIKTALAMEGRDSGCVRLPLCAGTPDLAERIRRLLPARVGETVEVGR